MGKSNTFFGQPIFSQMINLLDKEQIDRLAQECGTDHYCKKFSTFQHLITMVYGVTSGCNSLRELSSGIVSYGDKITHCKFDYTPRRSTISDANKRRDHSVFEKVYDGLVAKYRPGLSDSQKQIIIDKKAYAIDSTTIRLFQPIFECVGRNPSNGKRKVGVKSHQKLDLQAGIPVKVYYSDAREHDSLFIQNQDVVHKNEIAVFDKAYNNYALFDRWCERDIFFVTRLKDNAKERFIGEKDLLGDTPDEVLRDAKIALPYKDNKGNEKEAELRLVSYYDPQMNKAFYFLTNLFEEEASQIALLYKKRWQVELLFKKIKQNFPLQYFYGENKNAIQIQLWCTLIALLLITFMKKQLTKRWGFSSLISLLQKHLFTYAKFTDFFNNVNAYAVEFTKNSSVQEESQEKLNFSSG
ncbi:IS4 family transposase [Mesonia ostreae]|uniref:IS4 family transposase n=1 Tax=Mesonia ostreae TaxID=861110 RepID=A0ABU2KFX5_9FLAO|nr:IS4 family transposase [Mesonia ostreae]MDT0293558.1 IS4 family transposase [Mesonia ostreae]